MNCLIHTPSKIHGRQLKYKSGSLSDIYSAGTELHEGGSSTCTLSSWATNDNCLHVAVHLPVCLSKCPGHWARQTQVMYRYASLSLLTRGWTLVPGQFTCAISWESFPVLWNDTGSWHHSTSLYHRPLTCTQYNLTCLALGRLFSWRKHERKERHLVDGCPLSSLNNHKRSLSNKS